MRKDKRAEKWVVKTAAALHPAVQRQSQEPKELTASAVTKPKRSAGAVLSIAALTKDLCASGAAVSGERWGLPHPLHRSRKSQMRSLL
jgi:hypothetical protein